ncbi:hypothetical protein SPSIL_013610 [Sporomusa silvacetica DSM 10669]|uniref:Uncharacterized protein n=1 Tax=Sporomusa silvacetica DSM 10669 TaxID=1123289 RepID=A0ABZ3IHU3_9FIRM|nr:hypothetical protein [Sporomusa silvacetica]OZC16765.1 hypothetical protein SPSIL_36020 [Sporomusa silvacetica DSM 10669]
MHANFYQLSTGDFGDNDFGDGIGWDDFGDWVGRNNPDNLGYRLPMNKLYYHYQTLLQRQLPPVVPGGDAYRPQRICLRRCWTAYQRCLYYARTPWQWQRCTYLYNMCARRCLMLR